METLGNVVGQVGLPIGLVVAFVWWTFKREARMAERIDKLADAQMESQKTVITDNTRAMRDMTDSNKRQTAVLERLGDKLESFIRSSGVWNGEERRKH